MNGARGGMMAKRRRESGRSPDSAYRYVILHKPYGMVSCWRDRHAHPTLADVGLPRDLPPAGQLDADSEGLLLLTNDGLLQHRVTHPRHHHPKTYLVSVIGHPDAEALRRLRGGVEIKFGRTRPAGVEVLDVPPALPPCPAPQPTPEKTTWLRVVLYEGKNRQIRRMTAAVDLITARLVRVAIGPLTLPPDLEPGQWRDLTPLERRALLDWAWPRGRPQKRSQA